jgi:hypothetical protein
MQDYSSRREDMLKLLKFLLIIGGAMLLFANIEPYIAVTRLVFSDSTSIDICGELRPIPFIGGIIAGGCGLVGATIYGLAGFLVWGIFQIIELLPIANSFNIPFLSNLINRLQKAPQVAEEERDRDAVKQAKRQHNTVVERSLAVLLTFSWVMYVLDLILMCWLYSPLNSIGELNPMALVRVLLGVFGVELVIMGLTLINNIIDPGSIKYPTSDKKTVREY